MPFKKEKNSMSFLKKGAEWGLLGLKGASAVVTNPIVQTVAKEIVSRLEK